MVTCAIAHQYPYRTGEKFSESLLIVGDTFLFFFCSFRILNSIFPFQLQKRVEMGLTLISASFNLFL